MKRTTTLLAGALLAAFCAALSTASAASPGRYVGTARPGGTAVVRVTTGHRVRLRMKVRIHCDTGSSLSTTVTVNRPPKLGSDGRFSYRERGLGPHKAAPYRFRLSGRVRGGKVRGTFSGVVVLAPTAPGNSATICKGRARFSATRR